MEFGLLNFIKISPFIPFALIPFVVWSDVDPLYVPSLLQTSKLSPFRFLLIAFRVSTLTAVSCELLKSFGLLATLAAILLAASIQIMARCRKALDNVWTGQVKVIKVFKELQLWNIIYNQNLCYSVVPHLILFGMSIITLANYLTIRLPRKVPLMLYVIFPATSLTGLVFVMTIVPQATQVFEKSEIFLGCLTGKCFLKYERRLLYSLNKVGIRIGPFGTASKSLMLAIAWNIVYYTINLLIAF